MLASAALPPCTGMLADAGAPLASLHGDYCAFTNGLCPAVLQSAGLLCGISPLCRLRT